MIKTGLAANITFKMIQLVHSVCGKSGSGFPQTMRAGSQLFSLDNTTIFSPNTTWENRYGFIREIANATTVSIPDGSEVGLDLLGALFPGDHHHYADVAAATSEQWSH